MTAEHVSSRHLVPPEGSAAMMAAADALVAVCTEMVHRFVPPMRLAFMSPEDIQGAALGAAVAHLMSTGAARGLAVNSRAFALGGGFGDSLRRESMVDLQQLADHLTAGLGGVIGHGQEPQGNA